MDFRAYLVRCSSFSKRMSTCMLGSAATSRQFHSVSPACFSFQGTFIEEKLLVTHRYPSLQALCFGGSISELVFLRATATLYRPMLLFSSIWLKITKSRSVVLAILISCIIIFVLFCTEPPYWCFCVAAPAAIFRPSGGR